MWSVRLLEQIRHRQSNGQDIHSYRAPSRKRRCCDSGWDHVRLHGAEHFQSPGRRTYVAGCDSNTASVDCARRLRPRLPTRIFSRCFRFTFQKLSPSPAGRLVHGPLGTAGAGFNATAVPNQGGQISNDPTTRFLHFCLSTTSGSDETLDSCGPTTFLRRHVRRTSVENEPDFCVCCGR